MHAVLISPSKTIRIIVADDHPMMLMGVRTLLSAQRHIEVVGEAANAESAIELVRRLAPDMIVLDISLPGMNGLDAAALLRKELPEVKVVILSMYEDHEYVQQFVRSGATAYVLKSNSPQELLAAIEAVAKGQAYFSPSIAGKILKEQQNLVKGSTAELSARERQVLTLLARGMSSKQIAEQLCLSGRTVQKYREIIMSKLGLHSVADLTRYALARKMIDLDPL